MPSITVKNIPTELYEHLKTSAKINRRSINSEILVCLEKTLMSRKRSVEEEIERARELRAKTAHYHLTNEELVNAIETGRP